MSNAVFLGHGCIFIGDRDANGRPKSLTEIHTPKFEVTIESETKERTNTCGSVGVTDVRISNKITGKVMITTDEHNAGLLAIALGGEVKANSAITFTDLPFPAGLAVSDIVPVPGGHTNITTLSIQDNANTPLNLGTNYSQDLAYGLITILSIAGKTQPYKATGATAATGQSITVMTKNIVEKFIRFKGINIADNDKKCIFDIYRASFSPSKVAPKGDGDFMTLDFEGVLLSDASAAYDQTWGSFGKYTLLP